jgi:preprotein translocase subunit SecG
MLHVLLVIHLLIALALVGVILLQRSEGGALGIGGGGGVMTGRAAGNLLTRTTAILATGFFCTSLALALIANSRSQPGSIMDQPVTPAAPTAPAAPPAPTAPLSR